MRPIRLSIEGLRSFHSEPATVIEFDNREQLAIVGDTGAGKSSILEAMTWALYGQVSYSAHANQELINDQASYMRVVFAFWANDYQWVATRMCDRRRDGSVRPATVTLEKLDDQDERIELHEGVKQANAAARELLGLDVNAFLRTIVLPQGRFARLLTDDDPRSRANILAQIWRTDELDRGAADIGTRCSDLQTLLVRIHAVLEGEPEDAEVHAAGLREEAANAGSRATHAQSVEARGLETLGEAEKHDRTRLDADAAASELDAIDTGGLDAEAERIREERTRAAEDLRAREADEASAQERLERTESTQAGMDLARTARLLDDVRELQRVRKEMDTSADTVSATRAAATTSEAEAGEAEAAATAARQTLDRVRAEAGTALNLATGKRQRVRDADAAVETYEQGACQQARAASARLANATGVRTDLEKKKARQQTEAADAGERQAAAESVAESLSARHAAHRASAGHAPGDPCPVCEKLLDDDWTPPTARGLDTALRDARNAAENCREESSRLERIAGQLDAARREEESARQASEEAERRREKAAAQCAERTGLAPDDLAAGWEGRRRRMDGEASAAEAAADAAAGELKQAESRASEASRTAAQRRGEAVARDREAERAEEELAARARRATALERKCSADGWSADTDLDAHGEALEQRLATERRQSAERAEAASALATARERVLGAERRAARVEERVRAHEQSSSAAWKSIDAIAERLSEPAASGNGAGTAEMRAAVARLRKAAVRAATNAAQQGRAARNRLLDLLDLNGIDRVIDRLDLDGAEGAEADAAAVRRALREHTEERNVRRRAAEEAVAAFDERAPAIEALQKTRAEAETRLAQLLEIAGALKPGAFPKWLTLRRSTDLLRHASVRLEEMSRGQYAFRDPRDTEEVWKVLDRRTGATRSPATLSGGEQFIGSLALSLGMVETMGARGGRLESFFLDEGFGTLDRRALDMALEGLERAATPEHLVGVITHVREVAERIGHVLRVERSAAGGSRARWLTDEERRALAEGTGLGNLGLTSTA